MRRKLFLLYLCFFLISCSKYPKDVQRALELSGENRNELETVLEYFRDKGKIAFESACFLIGNMPYHESRRTTPVDSAYFRFFQQTDSIYQSIFSDMKLHEIQTYKNKNLDFMRKGRNEVFKDIASHDFIPQFQIDDLRNVRAEYLIDNIEEALEIWEFQGYTYKKDFNFFKEFILPYRTTNEFPNLKRSQIYNMFNGILCDSLRGNINDRLEKFKVYVDKCRWINHHVKVEKTLGIYDLFIPKFKMDCHNMTNWSCNVLRSCGIPTVYEFTPLWKDRDRKHFWCVSPDSNGILQPYTAPDNNLREDWETDIKYAGKVYRKTYGAQKESPYFLANEDEYIPEVFNTPLLSDQTFRYHQTITLRIPLHIDTSNRFAYLCMFTTQGNTPVAWGKIDHAKKEIVFEQVPLNTLFFPVCYDEDVMLDAGDAFMIQSEKDVLSIPLPLTVNEQSEKVVDLTIFNNKLVPTKGKDGNIEGLKYLTLSCNNRKNINLHLIRKYPEKRRMKMFQENLKNAVLVGSNSPKGGYDTLLVINETPKCHLQELSFNNTKKYRYYRFLTADKKPTNIAHMEFLGPYTLGRKNLQPTPLPVFSKGQKTKNKNLFRFIGEPLRTSSHPEHAFDNDVNTYVGASSIGMDFKKAVQVNRIRFVPRTANNMIVPGNSYLLQYYDREWKEFGIRYATEHYVDFDDVPNATLFWLRNLTEGKEELPFFYIGGKQYFLHTDTLPLNNRSL